MLNIFLILFRLGRSKPFSTFEKKVILYYLIKNSSIKRGKGNDIYKQMIYDGVSKF